MRILIVSTDFSDHVGGKATHIEILERGLRQAGHKVFVLGIEPSLRNKLLIAVAGRIADRFGRGIFVRHAVIRKIAAWEIKKIFGRANFDIINAQDINALMAVHKSGLRRPVVLTVHGEMAREMQAHGYIQGAHDYQRFAGQEEIAYQLAEAIVCVDSRIGEHVQRVLGSADKIKIFFNMIDAGEFEASVNRISPQEARRAWGIPENSLVVLVPRRLTEKCGVKFAAEAARIIIKKYNRKDIVFLLAGDGPQRKEIADYINASNISTQVKILGEVPYCKIPWLYACASVVAVPSITVGGYQEATSLAVLEAMSARVPVVASAIGGLKQMIKDKETGRLVPEQDSGMLAQSLMELLDDPQLRQDIAQRASAYVRENHDLKAGAQKFADLYENVARIFAAGNS